jgi:hypothetical protein
MPDEHPEASAGCLADQFAGQPGLADARFPADQCKSRFPLLGSVQERSQLGYLCTAADEDRALYAGTHVLNAPADVGSHAAAMSVDGMRCLSGRRAGCDRCVTERRRPPECREALRRAPFAWPVRDRRLRCGGARQSSGMHVRQRPPVFFFEGLAEIAPLMERTFGPDREGDWRLVPTGANRMPTAASYLRRTGDMKFRAFKFDVLRIENGSGAWRRSRRGSGPRRSPRYRRRTRGQRQILRTWA